MTVLPRRQAHGFLLAQAMVLAAGAAVLVSPASAQTIRGRLLDGENGQPIDLGLVIMLAEAGDSITYTVTDERGYFSVTSPDPGSFRLLASALGYRETAEGIFDLGMGGEITVDFRLPPEPSPLDEILVAIDRRVLEHRLVRNGFVRRYQRGLGHFITPYDIEKSLARTTEELFAGVQGMVVRPVDGVRSYLGDMVVMRNAGAGGKVWCAPVVFVDGVRVRYDHADGVSLSMLVPLAAVQAVEAYRSTAEVPVEYNITRSPTSGGQCGVLLFWMKY